MGLVHTWWADVRAFAKFNESDHDRLRQNYFETLNDLVVALVEDREHLKIEPEERELFISTARNCATCALNDSRADLVALGMTVLIVEDCTVDPHRTSTELHILDHAANALGLSLENLYFSLKPFATAPFNELMSHYIAGEDRTIASVGYSVVRDKRGRLAYKQNW